MECESSPPWAASEEASRSGGNPGRHRAWRRRSGAWERFAERKGVKRSIMAAHIHSSLPLPWTDGKGETAQTWEGSWSSSGLGRSRVPSWLCCAVQGQ